MIKSSFVLFGLLLVARGIKSVSGQASANADSSAATPGDAPPAPTQPVPPGGIGGFQGLPGGYPGGYLGFPGAGFQKSINFNAGGGFGPFLGGVGGVPPPVGGVPPTVDGGLGIGELPAGGFGGFGPSYLPSTWLGSALGAKGDFLFPCVIIIFFIVGVWVVIQFLLTLLVPLIGAKMGFASAIAGAKLRRSAEIDEYSSPEYTAKNITEALDKTSGKYC